MWLKDFKKYLEFFIIGVAFIVIYKTFDNFGVFISWGKNILSILTPFVIGFCIAYILYIPCTKFEGLFAKTKVAFFSKNRRGLSVLTIYLIFFLLVTLFLVAIIPTITKSIQELWAQLPSLISGFLAWVNSFGFFEFSGESIEKLLSSNLLSLEKILSGFTFDNVNRYAKGVMSFGTTLFNVFMGIIISIYILLDRKHLKASFTRFGRSFIPEKVRFTCGRYLNRINDFIRLYISCQLVDALIVFVLSFIVLLVLRVKYALLLSLMVGSFNLIPYFGAFIATALAAIITVLTKNFTSGLIVAAALIVIQQVDANLIQPRILSDSLNIRPVWVILAILIGGSLFGILGIFLAVPIMALLKVILIDILNNRDEKKALKEQESSPPAPPETE